MLRQLRVRSYRANRYRLGLPARGQRTHTNASTSGRNRDEATQYVRLAGWVRRLGEVRKRPVASARARHLRRGLQGKKVAKVTSQRTKQLRAERKKKKDP